MKKSIILSAILFSCLAFNSAKAQVSIHVGLNIPVRPVYVPAPEPVYDDNFDDSDDYYYLPEVEAYYSIPLNRYFYMDGSRWISAAYLPGAYRNYDWRSARRFEIRGRRPYMNHNVYRGRWGGNDNRNWNRFNNNYAGRNNNGYNGGYRDRGNWRYNQPSRGNGGYNQPNRNDDNHGRGNWANNQPSRDNWGGRDRGNQPNRNDNNHGGRGNWGDRQQGQPQQPNRNDDNRGGGGNWGNNQPQRGNNGFNQPNRNDDNRGGRGNWSDRQQGQPQQPNRNDDNRGRGNWGGGRERGNQGGGQIADNRPNTRSGFFRPRL
jgi:hypothetical protein